MVFAHESCRISKHNVRLLYNKVGHSTVFNALRTFIALTKHSFLKYHSDLIWIQTVFANVNIETCACTSFSENHRKQCIGGSTSRETEMCVLF